MFFCLKFTFGIYSGRPRGRRRRHAGYSPEDHKCIKNEYDERRDKQGQRIQPQVVPLEPLPVERGLKKFRGSRENEQQWVASYDYFSRFS